MDHLKLQQAFDRYLDLPADKNKVVATYIYVDLLNNLCAKARTLESEPKSHEGKSKRRVLRARFSLMGSRLKFRRIRSKQSS